MNVAWRRAAAYVACQDTDRGLLLTLFSQDGHPDSGSWTMPGGGMEWGETPEQTAARELYEESGLVADLGPILGVYSEWFSADEAVSGEPGHSIRVVFRAASISGDLRTGWDHDDTTVAANWFDLGEVQHLRRVPLVDWVIGRL